MTFTFTTENLIQDLLQCSQARVDYYKELLYTAQDEFSKTIITRLINLGLSQITDIASENYNVLLWTEGNSSNCVLEQFFSKFPIGGEKSQREVFEIALEIEQSFMAFHSEILQQNIPIPLNMILTQHFKDLKHFCKRLLFLAKV